MSLRFRIRASIDHNGWGRQPEENAFGAMLSGIYGLAPTPQAVADQLQRDPILGEAYLRQAIAQEYSFSALYRSHGE